jgi:hypothetical protein
MVNGQWSKVKARRSMVNGEWPKGEGQSGKASEISEIENLA